MKERGQEVFEIEIFNARITWKMYYDQTQADSFYINGRQKMLQRFIRKIGKLTLKVCRLHITKPDWDHINALLVIRVIKNLLGVRIKSKGNKKKRSKLDILQISTVNTAAKSWNRSC